MVQSVWTMKSCIQKGEPPPPPPQPILPGLRDTLHYCLFKNCSVLLKEPISRQREELFGGLTTSCAPKVSIGLPKSDSLLREPGKPI